MFIFKTYVEAGGLLSYGADFFAMHRQAATQVAKILRGAKVGDIPIEQPNRFEFAVNPGPRRPSASSCRRRPSCSPTRSSNEKAHVHRGLWAARRRGRWWRAGSSRQMPRVGWIWSGDPREIAGLKQGLRELGYVEGKNISIEYRFGDNSTERLLDLAADIAHLKLDIILVCGTPATKATQRAAPVTPIVFMSGDPVGSGLVTSLRRPGGNLTGFSMMLLSEKWPDLVRDMLPAVNHIGYLWNPADVRSAGSFGQARRSAEMLGLVFDSPTRSSVRAISTIPSPRWRETALKCC